MSKLTEPELIDALSGYLRVAQKNEALGAVAEADSGHEIGWEVCDTYEDLRRKMFAPADPEPLTDLEIEQLVNLGPAAIKMAQALRYCAEGKFT